MTVMVCGQDLEILYEMAHLSLKTWELNNKIIVEKNPHYWDASIQLSLNEIHYYPVSNVMTEDRMFRAGQLHVLRHYLLKNVLSYLRKNPD